MKNPYKINQIMLVTKPAFFFLYVLFFLFGSSSLFAQNGGLKWGVRGGSKSDDAGGRPYKEPIWDMTTDQSGNVYIIANVGPDNFDVDGHTFTFHGQNSSEDCGLIASFDCTGAYRWGKFISGTRLNVVRGIGTDTLGHVYVVGKMFSAQVDPYTYEKYTAHFGTDTIIPFSANPNEYKQTLFMLRYDTAGNLEELFSPQHDSINVKDAIYPTYTIRDLVVDPDGTQHLYMYVEESYPVHGKIYKPILEGDTLSDGDYILKYNAKGHYLGRIKLDMRIRNSYSKYLPKSLINHDPVSGSYYMSGYNPLVNYPKNDSLFIGGQFVESPMFAAKFDAQGQSQWMLEGENQKGPLVLLFSGRPQLDHQGNIYLSGEMRGNFNKSTPVVTFNGYSAQNQAPGNNLYTSFPVLLKLAPDGSLIWGTHADTFADTFRTFAAINGNTIAYTSSHAGIIWENTNFPLIYNSGYDVYMAQFNTSDGSLIRMDSIGSSYGFDEAPTGIAAGPRGNVYVGGEFQSRMHFPNDTLQNVQGDFGTDFFVAKFGQDNCNCTLPQAKFSVAGNNNGTVNFTYTGTPDYDELEWGFGNGRDTTTTTGKISETYTASGEYHVCVTAYNSCGYDTWCMTVDPYDLDIPALDKDDFTIYPNPVKSYLNVKTQTAFSYKLFSLTGKVLQSGTLEQGTSQLDVANLPTGLYLLRLEDKQGQNKTIKVMKE